MAAYGMIPPLQQSQTAGKSDGDACYNVRVGKDIIRVRCHARCKSGGWALETKLRSCVKQDQRQKQANLTMLIACV